MPAEAYGAGHVRVGTVRAGLTVRYVKVTESVWHEQTRVGGEWVFRREWSNADMDKD
jgi:hypothetical protein